MSSIVFSPQVRADTAHRCVSGGSSVRCGGVELLSYREKLMAGLPNFATYFGRDMLMTAHPDATRVGAGRVGARGRERPR